MCLTIIEDSIPIMGESFNRHDFAWKEWRYVPIDIIGAITDVETIAVGSGIRDLPRIRGRYGHGRWRKLKGIATVRLNSGSIRRAELHWYEAHGVGRRNIKTVFGLNHDKRTIRYLHQR